MTHLADGGLHSPALPWRRRRAAVPRVRGRDRDVDSRVGRRVADVHADAVEPVSARARRAEARSRCTARRSARYDWLLDQYRWTLDWTMRHRPVALVFSALVLVATVIVFKAMSDGLHSRPGHRPDQHHDRGGAGHVVRRHGATPAGDRGDRPARHERAGADVGRRRHRRLIGDEHRAARARAQAARHARVGDGHRERAASASSSHIPGIAAYVTLPPAIQIGGRVSKGLYQFTMQASDVAVLYPAAQKLIDAASTSTVLQDVTSDMQNNSPQVNVRHRSPRAPRRSA